MDEKDLRIIIEAVVKELAVKGVLKASCGCSDSKTASVCAAKKEVRVTMGSAGKLFGPLEFSVKKASAVPARPAEDSERDHTHGPDCPHCQPLSAKAAQALKALGADRIGVCHAAKGCNAIAPIVDHTLLKPNATQEEVGKLCEEARNYCFASVCVNPSYVALCAQLLKGSGVKVCTVVGFPLGSTTPTVKALEARDAIANGADEIDMVINVGALKSGNDAVVQGDIRAVRDATRGRVLKVILETSLLSDDEKVRACKMAKEVGADFVKTSTGFGPGGATAADVKLMRQTVGPLMGVKASGGIRDTATAQVMIEAGATRLGTSASVGIVTDAKPGGKGY